jgi:hypothetical protein
MSDDQYDDIGSVEDYEPDDFDDEAFECPECEGSGRDPNDCIGDRSCSYCYGTGVVTD